MRRGVYCSSREAPVCHAAESRGLPLPGLATSAASAASALSVAVPVLQACRNRHWKKACMTRRAEQEAGAA